MAEQTEQKSVKLKKHATDMRKNMTEEEGKLWHIFLKYVRPRFHRQQVIGDYIVDFLSKKAMLVIEVDGVQHYDDDARVYDKKRTEYLEKLGYKVLRYSNYRINRELREVMGDIQLNVISRLKELNPNEVFSMDEKFSFI